MAWSNRINDKHKKTSDLDPEKTDLLDKVARFVVDKNIEPIAVMTIESTRPLLHLGAQAGIFFEPFITMLFDKNKYELFRQCFEEKEYVDYLLDKIENPTPSDN